MELFYDKMKKKVDPQSRDHDAARAFCVTIEPPHSSDGRAFLPFCNRMEFLSAKCDGPAGASILFQPASAVKQMRMRCIFHGIVCSAGDASPKTRPRMLAAARVKKDKFSFHEYEELSLDEMSSQYVSTMYAIHVTPTGSIYFYIE
jgi:hypothetical protein